MVVLHTSLIEPQCPCNVALTVLFPLTIILPLWESSNLGCLQLTSPSARQPSLLLFLGCAAVAVGKRRLVSVQLLWMPLGNLFTLEA